MNEHERTVRSIATMLGWLNVPPRETLERDIAALKERAALSSAPPDPRPVTDASPAVGVDGYDGEHVLAWWPIMTLDDDGNLTDTISEGRWILTFRYGDGSWFEPAEMEADWCDDEQQYGEAPLFWLPLPPDPVPTSEGGGNQYPGVAASAPRDHQAGAAHPMRAASAPPDIDERVRAVVGACVNALEDAGCACWNEQPCALCVAQKLLADYASPAPQVAETPEDEAPTEPPSEADICRLEKLAWDENLDRVLVWYRDQIEQLRARVRKSERATQTHVLRQVAADIGVVRDVAARRQAPDDREHAQMLSRLDSWRSSILDAIASPVVAPAPSWPDGNNAVQWKPDDVVGHATVIDADGSLRHEPLTRREADALWKTTEEARLRRESSMPDEKAAIAVLFSAWLRLKELGWKEAEYCPKDGTPFDAIEPGSTGIHRCHYDGKWPDGHWWTSDEHDMYPSRPILWRSRAVVAPAPVDVPACPDGQHSYRRNAPPQNGDVCFVCHKSIWLDTAPAPVVEHIETCETCQMKLPEHLGTYGIGARGGTAWRCAVCQPIPEASGRLLRDEVVKRRKAHWAAALSRETAPGGGR